jgi:hypothetical protein
VLPKEFVEIWNLSKPVDGSTGGSWPASSSWMKWPDAGEAPARLANRPLADQQWARDKLAPVRRPRVRAAVGPRAAWHHSRSAHRRRIAADSAD